MDAGYGIVNFVYLYCLGYYIRHYYTDKHGAGFYFSIYLLSCLTTFLVNAGMTHVMGFYFNSMISYNTIFTLIGSVGLFMCFRHLEIKENRIITCLSRHSLAVYLIHMCPLVGPFMFTELMKVNDLDGSILAVAIIALPPIIYLVCTAIDYAVDFIITPIQMSCINRVSKRMWTQKR